MRIGERKKRFIFTEINVTPFVDVMLVLLVIFMVTAPLVQQSLNLSLPETAAVPSSPPQDPFVVKINPEGLVFLGSQNIPLKDLQEKLKAVFETKKDRAVYVHADKSVPYQKVAEALAEIQSAGGKNIHLGAIAR